MLPRQSHIYRLSFVELLNMEVGYNKAYIMKSDNDLATQIPVTILSHPSLYALSERGEGQTAAMSDTDKSLKGSEKSRTTHKTPGAVV